ncbi:MAG TPA: glycosyltransferase family 4 protein [Pyrinomonadaceae bacterium]|jgi:glycosyltransferase involved in cell wall biosynthesis
MGMPEGASLGGPAACEPPFVAELQRLGIAVGTEVYVYGEQLAGTTLQQRVRRVLRTARRLRRRLRSEPFDVLHLNSSFDGRAVLRDVATLGLVRRSPTKVFIKFHGSDADLLRTSDPVLRRFTRTLLARADGIGVLSTEEKENFMRAGVGAERIYVVKNVVAADETQAATDDAAELLRARLQVAAGVPLLLFIARFIPAKGLIEVIRACATLRERGLVFRLLCVGDGPARAAAEAEVARLRLRPHAQFFGYVPEPETRAFYAGSTLLVFPTYHYEGFPMVIFKSLAAGLPVITTRIRAARDYLREPDNCLWVEPRNADALAEQIARLLREPSLRAAMAANNRALAAQFTAQAVAPEYVAVYNQLLGGR